MKFILRVLVLSLITPVMLVFLAGLIMVFIFDVLSYGACTVLEKTRYKNFSPVECYFRRIEDILYWIDKKIWQ